MEYRFACVLSATTNSISKPYYTLDTMYREINRFRTECDEEAVRDYKEELEMELE